jgi:hypothetical protein
MYALQIVQWMYMGPSDVRYFLKYPIVNTWMYEAAFGPLGKNHRTYARVDGRPLIFRELMQLSPINNSILPSFSHTL